MIREMSSFIEYGNVQTSIPIPIGETWLLTLGVGEVGLGNRLWVLGTLVYCGIMVIRNFKMRRNQIRKIGKLRRKESSM